MSGDPEAGRLSTVVYQRLEDVGALEEAWRDLAATCNQPYSSPDWMWAWWRQAAPKGSRLNVIVVSREGQVLGIAPLFVESRTGVRRCRILGAGTSARVDFLALPGTEEVVATAVAGCLAAETPKPDAIIFDGIRRGSPWPHLLAQAWPSEPGPHLYCEYSTAAPYLELATTDFEAWLAARSGHFRARMRRGLRKLGDHGGAIRRVTDSEEVDRYVSEFARLHRMRWASRGGSGVLTPQVETVLREASTRSAGQSPVELWVVDTPKGTLSVQVFLRAGTELGYWLGGFDENGPNLRPGPALLTLFRVVDRAHATGAVTVDLGPGGQPYKAEFANEAHTLDLFVLCISRAKTPAIRLAFVPMRAKNAALRRLSPRFKKRLRRLQRTLARSPGFRP